MDSSVVKHINITLILQNLYCPFKEYQNIKKKWRKMVMMKKKKKKKE